MIVIIMGLASHIGMTPKIGIYPFSWRSEFVAFLSEESLYDQTQRFLDNGSIAI
jgi:hypothetical protein